MSLMCLLRVLYKSHYASLMCPSCVPETRTSLTDPLSALLRPLHVLVPFGAPFFVHRYSYREGEMVDRSAAVEDGRIGLSAATAPSVGDRVLPVWKGMAVSLFW